MRLLASILVLLTLIVSAVAQPAPQSNLTQTFTSFTKIGRGTDVSATTSTSRQAITAAPVAIVYNTGSVAAYVALGSVTVNAVVATSIPVPAGACVALNATGATHIAGITASDSATLQVVTGTGSISGCGGGGGGGGGTTTVTGNVGGFDFQLAPTITVDAGAYAAGDSMGGLITLTGAARTAGGSGILNGIRLKSNGGSTNTYWIYAWSKTPGATCTNNAPYVAAAGDSAYSLVGFPTSVVMGGAPGAWDTSTSAQLTALISNFKNQDTSPGTAIYICLVTAGAVTPAATNDITLNASGIQD